jgi:hypothetical protein
MEYNLNLDRLALYGCILQGQFESMVLLCSNKSGFTYCMI